MTFARAEEGPAAEVATELTRVVDRLRTMTAARLARRCGAYASAADAAHALAQRLADRTRAIEGGPPRILPRLGDLVVGDQVAVTGHDLLAAAGRVPVPAAGAAEVAALPGPPARAAGAAEVAALLMAAGADLRDLRLTL